MKGMSDTLVKIEKDNKEHMEQRMKMRLEEETKRMEMYMQYQLDIAKVFKLKLRGEAEPCDQADPHSNSQDTLCNEGGIQQQHEMALQTSAALFCYSRLREQNVERQGAAPSIGLSHLRIRLLTCLHLRGDSVVREPIPLEAGLGCVLWRLGHGHSSRSMSKLFGMGESTIRNTDIICRILSSSEIFRRYGISMPQGDRLQQIMTGFENITDLPHIAGALDGLHILQGIVESNKIFWSVVCRAADGVHDSTHFKECSLYAQSKHREALGGPLLQIQGETIRSYLIADAAYKARTILVKPYCMKARQFLQEKQEFDRKILKGRVEVENAFGFLKNSWKILRDLTVDLVFAPTVEGGVCPQSFSPGSSQWDSFVPSSQVEIEGFSSYTQMMGDMEEPLQTQGGVEVSSHTSSFAHVNKRARVESTPEKRTRKEWDDNNTHVLIKCYGDVYTHVKKRGLRAKDCENLTFALNWEIQGSYNIDQVRNKMDTLKKQYKKEKNQVERTGSVPSVWPFYEPMDGIFGTTPKVVGVPGAIDTDCGQTPVAEDVDEDVVSKIATQGKATGAVKEDSGLKGKRYQTFYRMGYDSFHLLKSQIEPFLPSHDTIQFVRSPITSDLALACVLWHFAHGNTTRVIAEIFGISCSTIRKYTEVIVEILCSRRMLARHGILIPSGGRLQRIMAEFEALTSLPNMCGVVDGSHIRLHRLPDEYETPSHYVCRHGFPSVLLQGVVDSRKTFWSVVCNAPEGVHDYTHFKECSLYEKLVRKEVLQEPTIQIQGETIRPYIVADSTYKLESFVLKDFRTRAGLYHDKKVLFDRQISKGRVVIENGFGMLKIKWRILREVNAHMALALRIAVACCVLHNFVTKRGEVDPSDCEDPHPNDREAVRVPHVRREDVLGGEPYGDGDGDDDEAEEGDRELGEEEE
ncbi:hypothetical protein L7F22_024386 [Adiantum nelumboides]|nr:hypothetical protein [Adiantum nelumboides]